MLKCNVNNGVLCPANESTKFELAKFEGKELLLEQVKETRTTRQNKLLWLWFTIIGNELGYSKEDIYELVLRHIKHTRTIKNSKTGEEIVVTKPTSNLPKGEFMELLSSIDTFASHYGILLPDPNEFLNLNP